MIKIGCCGMGFFSPKEKFGSNWKEKFSSRMQAYASLFEIIEIDSTFYRLPMIKTAERWHNEAMQVNRNFEFILKAPKEITHVYRFGDGSKKYLERFFEVAKALNVRKLLFQTPAGFAYSAENLSKAMRFFSGIRGYEVIWEPRGDWLTGGYAPLSSNCNRNGVILCTDPLRFAPALDQPFYYYRLHGFGKGMMYSYKFSYEELSRLKEIASRKAANSDVYILFNNIYMDEDAMRFKEIA